jgi:biopolymer transport protein ExbD
MLAGALLCLSGPALAKPKPADLKVRPLCGADGALKSIWIGNKLVELNPGSLEPEQIRAAIGEGRPAIHLIADIDVPYRCIGGLIFAFQRAGVASMGFVAQPSLKEKSE